MQLSTFQTGPILSNVTNSRPTQYYRPVNKNKYAKSTPISDGMNELENKLSNLAVTRPKKNRKKKAPECNKDLTESCQSALCDPLILKCIFSHLDTPDLLNSSLVCRLWQKEGRKHMRNTGRTVLHIGLNEIDLERMTSLQEILKKSTYSPFGGLALSLSSQLLKYESNRIHDFWQESLDFIQMKLGAVEIFSLTLTSTVPEFLIQSAMDIFLRHHQHLKSFKLKLTSSKSFPLCSWDVKMENLVHFSIECDEPSEGFLNGCETLIQNAKNLRHFDATVQPSWPQLFSLLQEKNLIKRFNCDFKFTSALMAPTLTGLTELIFPYEPVGRLEVEENTATVKAFLMLTSQTLRSLEISNKFLVQFATNGSLPPFSNLKILRVHLPELEKPQLLQDFVSLSKYFPVLNQVEIQPCSSPLWWGLHRDDDDDDNNDEEDDEKKKELESLPSLSSVNSVKVQSHRQYHPHGLNRQLFKRLGRFFPNAKQFYFNCEKLQEEVEFALKSIGSIWPDMETVDIAGLRAKHVKSISPAFTGVKDTEASVYEKYVGTKALENVLKRHRSPCITDKTKLRVIRIEVIHERRADEEMIENPGEVMLGNATGVMGFSRINGLTLQVYSVRHHSVHEKYRFKLNHLRAFVNVDSRCGHLK